jgi:hypothetical protein
VLVRQGFALPDVLGMTLGQLRAYSQAAGRARKRDHADLLVLLRGAQYDQDTYAKLLNALEGKPT